MNIKPQNVQEYLTEDKKNPYSEWISSLKDTQAQYIIDARLVRVRRGLFGNCKPVGKGVLELKIPYGPGYRVYFGRDGDTIVILLCGGTKRTQKKDIKQAQVYWEDYQRRH